MHETFRSHHKLLEPVLSEYVRERSRCHSPESFFRWFWQRESGHCVNAMKSAVKFLLIESWREALIARLVHSGQSASLPNDRRAVRDLVDPLLKAAASDAATVDKAAVQQQHRESFEFCEAVVRLAMDMLRKREPEEEGLPAACSAQAHAE